MMPDNDFTPEEQAVIDRLRSAPRPQLRSQAHSAIQRRLMAELDAVSLAPQPAQVGLPVSPLVVIIIIVLLAAAAMLIVPRIIGPSPDAVPTATLAPTATVQPSPSHTPDASSVPLAPTLQTAPTVPPAPTLQPTAEATPEPTLASPEPADQGPIIVVEGSVQRVNANVITIFDIEIWIDPGDPILAQIQVGKTIRVEGRWQADGKVIIAVQVVVIIVTAPAADSQPPPAPPGCKWTGKGNNRLYLKCSNKSE